MAGPCAITWCGAARPSPIHRICPACERFWSGAGRNSPDEPLPCDNRVHHPYLSPSRSARQSAMTRRIVRDIVREERAGRGGGQGPLTS